MCGESARIEGIEEPMDACASELVAVTTQPSGGGEIRVHNPAGAGHGHITDRQMIVELSVTLHGISHGRLSVAQRAALHLQQEFVGLQLLTKLGNVRVLLSVVLSEGGRERERMVSASSSFESVERSMGFLG